MEIISVTNKAIQLHKSQSDLSIICSHDYKQKRNVSTDISFFMSSVAPRSFAQIYKPDVIEIWRLKKSKKGEGLLKELRIFRIIYDSFYPRR